MFMNGWKVDVDHFATRHECEEKMKIYTVAAKQSNGQYLVWCEHRPRA
jgi:hypothetical protein